MKESAKIERVSSGIPGLDAILHGGFVRGNIHIISGPPGAGKTIMGNQIAFHHVKQGGRAIYVTILSEAHAHMLGNLEPLTFVDHSVIGDTLHYFNGYAILMQEGLEGLLKLLQGTMRNQRATVLVLEGLAEIATSATDSLAFKGFLNSLQVLLKSYQCTTFLLSRAGNIQTDPEYALVDGIVDLGYRRVGQRTVRELEILKLRASGHLLGGHFFSISSEGLHIYPRMEALLTAPATPKEVPDELLPLGIPELDAMLGGGIFAGSTTLALGVPGSGKTLLGLHFLTNGAERGEKSLYFGFYEPPPQLIRKGDRVGLQLREHTKSGTLQLGWHPAVEEHLDVLGERLLDALKQHGSKRLFIDGLNAIEQSVASGDRINRFLAALLTELRSRGVTTILASETSITFGDDITLQSRGVASLVENILYLRYVELNSHLYRLISILKVREGDYDSSIRQFHITPEGITVKETFRSAEAILTGIARTTRGPRPNRRRSLYPGSR